MAAEPEKRQRKRLILLILLLVVLGSAAILERVVFIRNTPDWFSMAQQSFFRGDVAGAAAVLEKNLPSAPRFAPGYELLADCYLAAHEDDRALLVLGSLAKLDPDRPHLMTRTAEAYLIANNSYTLRYAREAVVDNPRSPRARMILAYALARSGGGMDASFEAILAGRLAPTASRGVQQAASLQSAPPRMTRALLPLIFALPYESE